MILATRFYGRITGQSYNVHPLLILRSWDCCLLIILDFVPVQSFHISTANFRVNASVNFLVFSDKRPLLMIFFPDRSEISLLRWKRFGRCVISRPSYTFPLTQNVFANAEMVPWFYSTTPLQKQCYLRETSEKLLFCVIHAHAEHFLEQIWMQFKGGVSKFWYKKLWLLSGKKKKLCLLFLFLFFFHHKWKNPELST